MGFFDSVSPDGIAEMLRIRKFYKTQELQLLQKSIFIKRSKDDTKSIITFQFAFPTDEQCEIFRDSHKLAEKANALGSEME